MPLFFLVYVNVTSMIKKYLTFDITSKVGVVLVKEKNNLLF